MFQLENYAADKLIKVAENGQMKITASELEALVSGELIGDKNIVLPGVSGLSASKKNDISFLENLKYLSEDLKIDAGIIFVAADMNISQFKNKNVTKVSNLR